MKRNTPLFELLFTLALIVTACSSSTQKHVEGQWTMTAYANLFDSSTTLTTVDDNENFILQLNPDRTFFFTTDCNTISGEYSANDNRFRFLHPAATEMACDKEIVENCIKSSLSMIESFDMPNDSTMNLLGSNGNPLIKLKKNCRD